MVRREGLYEEWLRDLMVRYRVVLRAGTGNPDEWPDPGAIVSSVPDIWLDYASDRFDGRRRTLRLVRGEAAVTFKARVRQPPPGSTIPPSLAPFARDRFGRAVPVCSIDPRGRTIHVLADLKTAPVIEATQGVEPLAFLLGALIAQPLELLVRRDGEPVVGAEVRDRLDRWLRIAPAAEEDALRSELSLLESLAPGLSEMSGRLRDRMGAIAARLSRPRTGRSVPLVSDDVVDRELSMVRRLVEKRSCSALRFTDAGEVGGMANPAPEGGARGRGAVEFLYALTPDGSRPRLHLWTLPRGVRPQRNPRCLGCAEKILMQFQRSNELYRILDLILNFIETNRVGVFARSTGVEPFPIDCFQPRVEEAANASARISAPG